MGLLFMAPFGQSADESPRFAVDVALKIGQRFFTGFAAGLALEQKNGQRAKQGEIARRGGLTHRATVLVLGAIPAIVLPVFDAPVAAPHFQQSFWASLLGPIGAHGKAD